MADESHAMDAQFAHDNTEEKHAGFDQESPARPERTAGQIAKALQRRIGPERYRAWFESGTTTLRVVGARLHVDSQNQFVADWIGRHFAGELRMVAREALGDGACVDVAVAPAHSPNRPGEHTRHGSSKPQTETRQRRAREEQSHSSAPTKRRQGRRHHDSLAPDAAPNLFTSRTPTRPALRSLEDFVVGESNRLAYSAAQRIAQHNDPADTSALLIYGECGVGKTHILQGICRGYNEHIRRPGAARYLTAEQFTNEYITAVRQHTLDSFRREYRRLELLAIDDVHFLASKTATQNEFLHTMDAIDLSGARLVLASDQHPRQIPQLHPSLVSRLVARLVVRIDTPDRETRLKIVKALAAQRGLVLLHSATEAIAARCQGSVREIQGALAQLAALRDLAPGDSTNSIGTLLTDQLFRNHDPLLHTGPVRIATIIDEVCSQLGIERADLFGRSRHVRVVLGRGLITFLARQMTSHSYPEIAAALGRRCHSTVHAACRRIETLVQSTVDGASGAANVANPFSAPAVRAMIEELRTRIMRSSAGRAGE